MPLCVMLMTPTMKCTPSLLLRVWSLAVAVEEIPLWMNKPWVTDNSHRGRQSESKHRLSGVRGGNPAALS